MLRVAAKPSTVSEFESILFQGIRPSILKVFAFSCRIVFRLIFFTFGNLTILVFCLNDQRIDKWRTILLGENAAFVGKTSQKVSVALDPNK